MTMNKEKIRLCRNIGKPEFIAALKKIKAMLEAGYDRRFIHSKLKAGKVVTMSYSTFCVHFNKFKESESKAVTTGDRNLGASSTPPRANEGSRRRAAQNEPFSIDRSRPVEELM